MKLYIITIDDVYELEAFHNTPIVKTSLKEARKEIARLKASAKETYKDKYKGCESDKDSFSLYQEGRWAENHYDARIDAVEVPLTGKTPGAKLR